MEDAKRQGLPLYLGLDLSTQQIKAVCIDDRLTITHEFSVAFDEDLPEFKTSGGVQTSDDGLTVTTPTLLWVKALDLLLCRMYESGFPFGRVVGVSGSGQQHGSVYWKNGTELTLARLQSTLSLHQQLQESFSVSQSPVWKDSSTTSQCRHLETVFGGPLSLAMITGSRAYERFTGNQIAKIFQENSNLAACTERISLISSFLASLLLGGYANIDYSDGSGMNLLDISSKKWSTKALLTCAPDCDLQSKLGNPVPSNSILGCIAPYYCNKFGFSQDCKVIAFTGDNPSSLAGMRLSEGDIVISLGTSDTLTIWITLPKPQLVGHVFVNPIDETAYMAMLCYKNGGETRKKIRNSCASGDWEEFNRILGHTEPGNNGNIGIYFLDPEITPQRQGVYRWNSNGDSVPMFPPEIEVRAIIEGQFMAKWIHACNLGYHLSESSRILATGGASQNMAILQIIADVFNMNVYVMEGTANSASVGGAYRAKHSLMYCGTDYMEAAPPYILAVTSRPHIHKVYKSLSERYTTLENSIKSK